MTWAWVSPPKHAIPLAVGALTGIVIAAALHQPAITPDLEDDELVSLIEEACEVDLSVADASVSRSESGAMIGESGRREVPYVMYVVDFENDHVRCPVTESIPEEQRAVPAGYAECVEWLRSWDRELVYQWHNTGAQSMPGEESLHAQWNRGMDSTRQDTLLFQTMAERVWYGTNAISSHGPAAEGTGQVRRATWQVHSVMCQLMEDVGEADLSTLIDVRARAQRVGLGGHDAALPEPSATQPPGEERSLAESDESPKGVLSDAAFNKVLSECRSVTDTGFDGPIDYPTETINEKRFLTLVAECWLPPVPTEGGFREAAERLFGYADELCEACHEDKDCDPTSVADVKGKKEQLIEQGEYEIRGHTGSELSFAADFAPVTVCHDFPD